MVWAAVGSIASGLINQRSANKQMRFEDQQSRTQYQRAVADMKAAGLNPMLSAKLGGNQAMGGASATMPDIGQSMTSAKQADTQRKLVNAQVDHIEAQAEQARANASLARTQSTHIVSQQQAGLPSAQAEAALSAAEASRSSALQSRQNVEKMIQEIKAIKQNVMIQALSIPEQQAMANVYRVMDGDAGRAIAFLQHLKKGGAGFDLVIQTMGLGSLLKKIQFGKSRTR